MIVLVGSNKANNHISSKQCVVNAQIIFTRAGLGQFMVPHTVESKQARVNNNWGNQFTKNPPKKLKGSTNFFFQM